MTGNWLKWQCWRIKWNGIITFLTVSCFTGELSKWQMLHWSISESTDTIHQTSPNVFTVLFHSLFLIPLLQLCPLCYLALRPQKSHVIREQQGLWTLHTELSYAALPLYSIALHCTALHCTVHCALHYTALHCTALHCTLQYTGADCGLWSLQLATVDWPAETERPGLKPVL